MSPEHEALTVETRDGVATITLSRPDLFNRFDGVLHSELVAALEDIAQANAVRAVVLRSTGKAFSAGGDFELMHQAHADAAVRREVVGDARQLLRAFLDLPQPIIAVVQGPAVGLGATVAMLCDALVAVRSATLADTHVNVGLVAGDGGCLVWPSSAGMMRARRHLLTGDPLDAETAFALGVVTDLSDDTEGAWAEAAAIAARIAALPPLAVQGTKRALNRVQEQRAGEVIDLSLALEEQTMATEDHLEGVTAFQERRRPAYTGR